MSTPRQRTASEAAVVIKSVLRLTVIVASRLVARGQVFLNFNFKIGHM